MTDQPKVKFEPTDPLVFGLHGMGAGLPGWADELFDALDAAIKTHGYAAIQQKMAARKVASVRGLVQFVEICYGDVFQDVINHWAENAADAIKRAATIPDRDKIERAVGWLEKSGKANDAFVWTHLADVFFWLSSSYIRARVKNKVAKALTSELAKRREASKGYRFHLSLVAHSLGTTIARETLEDLYGGGWDGVRWIPELVQFDSYHAIANVSQLMNFGGAPPYNGFVRPGPSGEVAVLYFNHYHHYLDPFTIVRPFDPPNWSPNQFDDVEVRHFRDVNVHAIKHYVAHPSVHIRILRKWFNYFSVGVDEEAAAQAAYPDLAMPSGGAAAEQLASLVGRDLTQSPDLIDIVKAVSTFASTTNSRGIAVAAGSVAPGLKAPAKAKAKAKGKSGGDGK